MSSRVEVYWSFRSPYSYLATPRISELARRYDVDINVRPVLPLAVRIQDFFETVNPLWPAYLLNDVARLAEYHGVSIAWPRPDPIVQDFATREVAKEQPYIYRLTRLGACAAQQGCGLGFIDEVSRIIWDGSVDGWDQGDHLALATERAGLDLAEMEGAVEADPEGFDAVIEANQRALAEAGHWGVPTMVLEGEAFFGQDRIDLLRWRLEQRGLGPG